MKPLHSRTQYPPSPVYLCSVLKRASISGGIAAVLLGILTTSLPAVALDMKGALTLGGEAVPGAKVTLWKTAGTESPRVIRETSSDAEGFFELKNLDPDRAGNIYYISTAGGVREGTALMSVIGETPLNSVVINELTTVASVFTSARFINGARISGNPLGVRIAAGNASNLVDPITGTWGNVLLNSLNSTQNTTLARLNTLGSMIVAFGTIAEDPWRAAFLNATATGTNPAPIDTLEALSGIAKAPWANPEELFKLFEEAYPQPKDGSRREAPYAPYLAYAPKDFAMILSFAGGGIFAPGKLQIDDEGNIWSGVNWMPGSQSGVYHNIGGGTIKLSPKGTALSPPITGFTGMGVDGIGWGTGMANDRVWVSSFNGSIGVMDLEGRQIGQESDFPMAGKVGNLMGVGVAGNGDVWIADATKNQLLYFPGGEPKDGSVVDVKGLKSPFGIAIDRQNRVWVSSSQSNTVTRFPASDPSKSEAFEVGTSARGVALDSKGNLWVASNMSPGFPAPTLPAGTPIMKQFQLMTEQMLPIMAKGTISAEKPTGVLNMIRADGSQPAPKGFTGDKGVFIPWGVSIDGNDDVWFGNFWGRGVGLMAGDDTQGHPEGTKTGDVIHVFQSGSIQMITDVVVDQAGNAWAANNWNDVDAVVNDVNPARESTTWGGGTGITVIYGVASPVHAPAIGEAHKPK
ncbi:hypothetical protein [Candidatus Marimicrobium litorale]|uniref:Streptogramin lyase n=1 Tax=Candidatus Marimicrobium litorale TaxID=2518991 RepID=A0ABT3T935_9GAMM|nr:hypothetical protein [Candidatus Marimicrobium litorale]MCX2978801.1 hypothetical protein [Candidatus Marimicrobium litorale]